MEVFLFANILYELLFFYIFCPFPQPHSIQFTMFSSLPSPPLFALSFFRRFPCFYLYSNLLSRTGLQEVVAYSRLHQILQCISCILFLQFLACFSFDQDGLAMFHHPVYVAEKYKSKLTNSCTTLVTHTISPLLTLSNSFIGTE